ncbi:MAG: monoheme cytochrome C [Flavobacteriales bacterium]
MSNEQLTPEQKEILDKLVKRMNLLVYTAGFIVVFVLFNIMAPDTAERLFGDVTAETTEIEDTTEAPAIDDNLVVEGIHVATGLIVDDGFIQVKASCTSCHSANLITQNRADRKGWEKMIRWMQETQNLWDLGPNEPIILDYLAKNYAPVDKGRRANLSNIEWYALED